MQRKTIIIGLSSGNNSLSFYMQGLGKSFAAINYKVILVFDRRKIPNNIPSDFEIHSWPSGRPTKLQDFKFIYNLCKQERPEIVMASFSAVNLMMIAARLTGVSKRLAWYHNTSTQISLDTKYSLLHKKWLYLRKSWLVKLCATKIITNSEKSKGDAITMLDYPAAKILPLNLLVKNLNIACKQREQNIVVVARLEASKGHKYLLDALQILKNKNVHFNAIFLGDGILKEALIDQATKLGIIHSCTFMGNVSRAIVFKTLSEAKVHVSASIDEAFGMVNVEALAVGTPILGQDVGGISDIIQDDVNGHFIDVEQIDHIAAKLETLLTSTSHFERLSKGALSTFKNYFEMNSKNLKVQREQLLIEVL